MADNVVNRNKSCSPYITCPIFWNLTKKFEKWAKYDEETRQCEFQRINVILDTIKIQDSFKNISQNDQYAAFCYAFRNGNIKHFNQFLKMWPEKSLLVKANNEVDYMNLDDMSKYLMRNSLQLLQVFCELATDRQLNGLQILDLSQLPVYFNERTIPFSLIENGNLDSRNKTSSDFDCSKNQRKIILNCSINGEEAYETIWYYANKYYKMMITIEFRYLQIVGLEKKHMEDILVHCKFTKELNGISVVSTDLTLFDLMYVVNELPQKALKQIKYLNMENELLKMNPIEKLELFDIKLSYERLKCLKSLNLEHNNMHSTFNYHIDLCPPLESLQIQNCNLSSTDLKNLLESKHMRSLNHLDLSRNDFGNRVNFWNLLKIIQSTHLHLQTLVLIDIKVETKELQRMGDIIVKYCKLLKFVNIIGNPGANEFLVKLVENLSVLRVFVGSLEEQQDCTVAQYIHKMHEYRRKRYYLAKVYIKHVDMNKY